MRWDTSSDQLLLNLEDMATTARELTPTTKQSIVSLVGRFYDPLGYLALVVVQFKIFLRELCEAKLEWDQPLPNEFMKKWNTLSANLQYAQPISIAHCYLEGVLDEIISCTLCGFCDASLKAYAGVIYTVLERSSGYSVKFIAAKTQVAPL